MHINKIQNQELFCKKYWRHILSNNTTPTKNLSQSFYIHEINQYLMNGSKPMAGKKASLVIAETDKDFKNFKKTNKELTLWRGICGAEIYNNPYLEKLLAQCKELKEGDILRMREYAYASDDKAYAEGIYTQDDGILYEITVPKGAQIADDWNHTFPRESMFLCTQNELVKDKDKKYHLIKLTYLLPDNNNESSPNQKKQSFLQKLKTKFLNRNNK